MTTHRPVAHGGHGYLSRRACVNLGLPDEVLPPGDEIALVVCRDAVTDEPCTHFGDAGYLRAYLIWCQTFGFPGHVNDEGYWVGDDLPFTLCAKGTPSEWLEEVANTRS